jgi:hypothetical protein
MRKFKIQNPKLEVGDEKIPKLVMRNSEMGNGHGPSGPP